MPDLAQRHLVVIVISQQQPLAGLEVRYRPAKRGYHRITIAIAHIIEVRRRSAFRLLSRVGEAIHILRLFGLDQPARLTVMIGRQLKDHRAKPASQRASTRVKRKLADPCASGFTQSVQLSERRIRQLLGRARILGHRARDADHVTAVVAKEVFPRSVVAFRASRRQTQVISVERRQELAGSLTRLGAWPGIAGGLIQGVCQILLSGGVYSRSYLGVADRVTP